MQEAQDRIRAQDLRIGNLLWKDGIVVSIDATSIMNIERSEKTGKSNHSYQAIPLSEDWLIRFGFRKTNVNSFWKNGVVIVWAQSRNRFEFHAQEAIGIQFVHTLQNLFFSLTQTELNLISKPAQSGENMKG